MGNPSAEVVRVEDARQFVAAEYQRVRERVMQIPSSVAPIVAQLNTPTECMAAVQAAVIGALADLTAER